MNKRNVQSKQQKRQDNEQGEVTNEENEGIVWDMSETDKIKSEKLRFKNADDIYDD